MIGDTDDKIKDRLAKLKSRKYHVSEKINFADTCEYLGATTPGPGYYSPRVKYIIIKLSLRTAQ